MRKEWFEQTESGAKKTFIKKMFNDISGRYDLMNRLMSLGLDRKWRETAIRHLEIQHGHSKILDIACGTGDMVFNYLNQYPQGKATALDFSEKMLRQLKKKVGIIFYTENVTLVLGDGEILPFSNNRFNAVTIAFGIRNMPNVVAALKEMYRVLQPGGKLIILEITRLPNKWANKIFSFYFHDVIPVLGGLIGRNQTAYTYLPKSVEFFFQPEKLAEELKQAGFKNINVLPLTFGSVHLLKGIKN